jgi:hypothetical protein
MAKTQTKRTKAEPKTRKRKADDPAQYARFRQFAREHGADNDPEAFDRRFRKIVAPKSFSQDTH